MTEKPTPIRGLAKKPKPRSSRLNGTSFFVKWLHDYEPFKLIVNEKTKYNDEMKK
jgi:hypothetical protein